MVSSTRTGEALYATDILPRWDFTNYVLIFTNPIFVGPWCDPSALDQGTGETDLLRKLHSPVQSQVLQPADGGCGESDGCEVWFWAAITAGSDALSILGATDRRNGNVRHISVFQPFDRIGLRWS
ncbi:MAG: hypothetical protein CML66_17295 [Rhodobacteraceae bacterium]|nr:hypothetical protein [Paracoccaceae bacterium]|tara:strand:- start:385 stop:759 length:375 start_codon:yes stop_codon:yes gene_type:complete